MRVRYRYTPVGNPADGNLVLVPAARVDEQDLNSDGALETATVVRDSQAIGPTGSLDKVKFVGPGDPSVVANAPDGVDFDKIESATGTIDKLQLTTLKGVQTTMVRVKTSINNPGRMVDLGPVERWPSGSIKIGDLLVASGPVFTSEAQTVLIAEKAKLNAEPEQQIRRPWNSLDGKLVSFIDIESKDKLLLGALLETPQGKFILDLGPESDLKCPLKPGVRVIVEGKRVKTRQGTYVTVSSLQIDDQVYTLKRS